MPDFDALLTELRAMRARLDKIAAAVVGQQQREELAPMWDCGHRHPHRAAALACREAARKLLAEAEDGA